MVTDITIMVIHTIIRKNKILNQRSKRDFTTLGRRK